MTTTSTEEAFIETYNAHFGLRKAVDKALISINMGLEEFEEPTTWAQCLQYLEEMLESTLRVEIVQGIAGQAATLYPLATYGWDGGNAINTKTINLTELVYVDVAGGPCANIVKRTDPSYPGVAFHHAESGSSLTIQLF